MGAALAASSAPGAAQAGPRQPGHTVAGSPADPVDSSIGFAAAGENNFDELHHLTSGGIDANGHITTGGDATSSAISPDGNTAVFADYAADLTQIEDVRAAAPTVGPTLDLSAYTGEGADDFGAFSSSVALSNGFGLAALDSQGVLQLEFSNGAWQVDTRVQSPGVNEQGQPHQPGWIRFGTTGQASVFDSVAISNSKLPNGKYLALSADRGSQKGVLAVVEGVGTAKPKLVGKLRSPDLERLNSNHDTGTGGIAFSPVTATRAVMATNNGIDVLDLSKPSHPTILRRTTAGTAGTINAIAVAPDGNHVALASASKVAIFKGLLHTSGSLTKIGKVVPAAGDISTSAMAYLVDGRLVDEHSGYGDTAAAVAWYASVITKAQTKHPAAASTVELTAAPAAPNAMSVYPALTEPSIRVKPTLVKAGKPAKIKLKVHSGYGSYSFSVTRHKLPAGLAINGDKIVGTPKHTGERTVTLRAKSQYGGAVFIDVTIAVD